jgi:predicted acylesterase/phospholipase RssA
LVDGALMNNLPVDVMRDLCQSGPVIAVDVSAETDLTEDYQFRAGLSGWKVLWSKLNPFSPEIKAPGLFDTLRRSIELNGVHQKQVNKALADLYINPPVAQFGSGEFEAYETLIEVGYQSAQAAIGTWLNKQMEIWNQKYRPGLAD